MSVPHQQLLDAIFKINAADNTLSFSEAAVGGVTRLIASDVAVFQALDLRSQRIVTHMTPPGCFTEKELAYYTEHARDHPINAYYATHSDQSARRISDVTNEDEWVTGKLYRACLQRLSLRHTIALPVTIDESIVVGLSLSRREPNFTRQDCELLDLLGPHLRQAWQRHQSPWADRRELECRQHLQALGLSAREAEVLFWMTEGKVNREVAMLLGISLSTVQEHVANILAKLKLENRHAATVFAIARLQPGAV
jgi:DNA-binding CsgD family transcriptional regulator